mgnify:CR=1 FL=1
MPARRVDLVAEVPEAASTEEAGPDPERVEAAIATGNATEAQNALKSAQPEIMRGVSKGVLSMGTASRKVSRLAARVKSLKAA